MSARKLPAGPRLLSRRDGPVLVLTLSNPAARNAMHPSLYRAAVDALRAAAADRELRAIVLTGEGEHFCGGGDLRRLADPVVVAAWQDSVAAPFKAKGIPTYANESEALGVLAQLASHTALMRQSPPVAARTRAGAAGRQPSLPERGREPRVAG